MKLTFVKPHKSIRSFQEIELPDFVVLTGVNGAGKSHLLEAIEGGHMSVEGIPYSPQTRTIRKFDWSNLVPNDTGPFTGYQSRQERGSLWNEFSNLKNNFVPQLLQSTANHPQLSRLSVRQLATATPEILTSRGVSSEAAVQMVAQVKDHITAVNQNFINQFIQNDPNNRRRLTGLMQAANSIPLIASEEEDFFESFPNSWQPVDMFQQSFSRLFADYQETWRQNQFRQWQNSRGKNFPFLDDNQFFKKYGTPPWEFVNNILEAADIDFRINSPDELEDRPYEPILTDLARETKVRFNDLSSGERVLMSFALCLYYANDSRQIVEYPKMILFDEIDAPLHPSMTQSLLRTIESVLVEQKNIKVILTTHSPSTVALAPESSLFSMRKSDHQRMTKSTKDSALSVLMAGVPSLSINYENRRQIFVESHHDVGFYDKFFQKTKPNLLPEISLNFISSGSGRTGGSDHVKDVVRKLSEAGNKTIFGIIDWDLKNSPIGNVRVLGEGDRYSIENYIFDPILVAALLVREKVIQRDEVGLNDHETYVDFSKMDNERLQKAADFVVGKFTSQMDNSCGTETRSCSYIGGNEIDLPVWLLTLQGHKLEQILKTAFPALNAFHGEAGLKNAVLERVVDDLPSLIPTSIVKLLEDIQRGTAS